MEVRIRLQRSGKASNKHYNYRVVAMSRAEGRDGRHLDLLGYYEPSKKPAVVSIDKDKLDKWLQKGAQMSSTVRSLLKNLKAN